MNLETRRWWFPCSHHVERPPEVDRISALPENVLLRIISRVPVEQWTALSAVSRSWRRLFSLHPRHALVKLRFPGPNEPLPTGAFPRALLRRCHIVCRSTVNWDTHLKLLREAKGVCVRELILESDKSPNSYEKIEIHEFVLSIKSLTSLKLIGCCLRCSGAFSFRAHLPYEISVGCKYLQILHIENTFIENEYLDAILASCLVLETLFFTCTSTRSAMIQRVRIRSRSLKHLRLILQWTSSDIDVDAPELKILEVQKYNTREEWPPVLSILAPKTQEVLFDFEYLFSWPEAIKEFLHAAEDLRSMKLRSAALQIFDKESWNESSFYFKKLRSVSISLDILRGSHMRSLVKLLEIVPAQDEFNDVRFPEYMFYKLKKSGPLSHELKKVNMHLLLRGEHEIQLVNFFVAEVKCLKKMKLHLHNSR